MSARIGGEGANILRVATELIISNCPKDALEKMIWAEADKLGYLSILLLNQF
jgi:zinc protease